MKLFTPVVFIAFACLSTTAFAQSPGSNKGQNGQANLQTHGMKPPPPIQPMNKPVLLGLAGQYTILAAAGISSIPGSSVTGNIGVSPIAATAITGFSLTLEPSGVYSKSDQVSGQAFAASYGGITAAVLTVAVDNMRTAYTDAYSRDWTGMADTNLDVKAGIITGETFVPGVYRWGSDVTFTDKIYIKGNKYSRYIFQSSGNVVVGSGANVILQDDGSGFGMPDPANIVWVMAGYLDAGSTSHLEGIFLTKTKAVLKTGSSLNGRILTQTACTLDQATIVGDVMKRPVPVGRDDDTAAPPIPRLPIVRPIDTPKPVEPESDVF